MALRKNKTKKFEEVTTQETAAAEEMVEEAVETTVEEKEMAPVEKQNDQIVAKAMKRTAPTLVSLRNQLNPEEFGTGLRRLKAGSGSVETTNGEDLGRWVDVQVLSSSERYMITPISDDDDTAAAAFCRASYDGKTIPDIDGGEPTPIEEYIKSVEDYEFNKMKKYLDIFCIVLGCENKQIETEVQQWDMCQISISPTGVQAYRIFEKSVGLAVARGLAREDRQDCLRMEATKKQGKVRSYTVLQPVNIPSEVSEKYRVV